MKLLVVLALVTVAVCLTEGLLVSKCDLRDHLTAAALRLPPKAQHYMTNADFVAKIVCHVEKTSGFDTGAVNQVNIDKDGKLAGRKKRCAKHEHDSKSDSHEHEVDHEAEWTLYGLFQLSDHLICKSDDDTSSVNLCQMDCKDLINDDIADDIDCLENIKMKLENGSEHREAVFMMAKLLFTMDCAPVKADEYFKEC